MPPAPTLLRSEARFADVSRTNLIVYLSKARPALEEISDQVIRARVWLENDQRVLWERELRRRSQKLQDAQQAMFSAELSNLREVSADERMAVQKAKRAVQAAEDKLAAIKKWTPQFRQSGGTASPPIGKITNCVDQLIAGGDSVSRRRGQNT